MGATPPAVGSSVEFWIVWIFDANLVVWREDQLICVWHVFVIEELEAHFCALTGQPRCQWVPLRVGDCLLGNATGGVTGHGWVGNELLRL